MTSETERKPKIYLIAEPGGFRDGDVLGFALAEDGHCIQQHLSSSVEWSKHDMGLTSNWHHDNYANHYPQGYELEWVDDPDKHDGFQKALELNKALTKAEVK